MATVIGQTRSALDLWDKEPTGQCAYTYSGPQPAVPHIHGGEVAPLYDGGPDAWYLPINGITDVVGSGSPAAPGAGQAQFIYPTEQQAGTIWFHDDALGITRLNVYAGMAGLYIITDPLNEPAAGVLPAFPQHDDHGRWGLRRPPAAPGALQPPQPHFGRDRRPPAPAR